MEMAFADETQSVGRVTPCALPRVGHSSDGPHLVTRPTSTALFVLTLGLIAILPWPCVAADAGFNIRAFTNSIGMKFVLIPRGEFMMGSTAAEADLQLKRTKAKGVHTWYQLSPPSEVPPHRVKITKPFYLGTYEVTLGEFGKFVEATGYRTDAEKDGKGSDGKVNGKWTTRPEFNWRNMGYERSDDMPVVNVTWNDAVAFCEWLTKKEGTRYRLPTEAEWEYACRAGTTTRYFWGDDEAKRNEYVWHGGNSNGGPRRVGELKPNAWGLYDVCGNAYEYCSDWFSTNYYALAPLTDPKGATTGEERVVRSGSWGTDPMHCRSAFRGGAGPTHRNMRDGFRVVREVE
jgi:eukaryotic-like serine/threonine-protein kinase